LYGGTPDHHYSICTICGEHNDCLGVAHAELHTGTDHEWVCGCGYTSFGSHNFGGWEGPPVSHYRLCTICGEYEFCDEYALLTQNEADEYIWTCSCGYEHLVDYDDLTIGSTTQATVSNEYKWFAFTASRINEYYFYTEGNLDTYGEIFEYFQYNGVISGRLQYDSNSGAGNNFKMTRIVRTNETIYLRISSNSGGNYVLFVQEYDMENNFVVLDPTTSVALGTEVTMHGGTRGGTTITEGYTRNAYLIATAPDLSRLAYDWSVFNGGATISAYGTITAINLLSVADSQDVLVKATLKTNSAVYSYIVIILLRDVSGIKRYINGSSDLRDNPTDVGTELSSGLGVASTTANNIVIHVGKTRKLSFVSGAPSALLQNYIWTTTDANVLYVDSWGIVYAGDVSVPTTVVITATYMYNSNFECIYTLIVYPL
jgi:hypothetical protein